MMTRKFSRTLALLVALLLLGVSALAPGAHASTTPTPPYSPPSREQSPFTSPDSFCTAADNRFDGIARTDPRLKNKIALVVLTPASDPTQTAQGSSVGDATDEIQTFAALINRCGGIGGQRIDVHVLAESGDPVANCVQATQRFHAFIVASWTASPAQGCVARDEHTVMVTESDVSNTLLASTSGRLVATGSSEGVVEARLLDLIDSGRLSGKRVAIVAGTGDSGAFERTAAPLLAANKIPVVSVQRADAVLEPSADPTTIPALTLERATVRHHQPLEIYGFSDATSETLDQLRQVGGADVTQMLNASPMYSFASVDDPQYRETLSPNTFSEMCNQEFLAAGRGPLPTTTTTQPPNAPLSATYLQIAKVCLMMRIVARGLFNAGVQPDQRAVIRALHRLPYIDSDAPGGTPKPRPNQVVNEPVARIEQVVVLTKVQSPCTSTTSTTAGAAAICWTPVSGWDDGGRVVNAPLSLVPYHRVRSQASTR